MRECIAAWAVSGWLSGKMRERSSGWVAGWMNTAVDAWVDG